MTSADPETPANSAELYHARNMEEIARRWDTKADQWDRALEDPSCHLNEDRAYERFVDHLVRLVQQRQDFCGGRGIIDVGCATGLVLSKVISSFAWGVGVDLSPKMIRLAQAKGISNARFIVGDCFRLTSLCPKAGCIASRGVLLSHYGEPHALELLRSALAALEAGGFILWDFLNQDGRDRSNYQAPNKTYFHGESVRGLALKAGFAGAAILSERDRRVGLLLAARA